jgi:hypothetical protein
MAAKRCAKCVINWSEEVVGGVAEPTACPQCEGGLVWQAQSVPDSSEGDVIRARHAQFDRFYEERGEREVINHPEVEPVDWGRLDAAIADVGALKAIPVEGEPLPVEPLPAYKFGYLSHLLTRSEA